MEQQYVDAVAEPTTVGTKRRYERDEEEKPCGVLEKRNKCNYWEDDDALLEPPAVGAKRGYERDEGKSDVIFEKRFKCNDWEDPASALHNLQRWGSQLAQMAALDNSHESFMQEMAAWRAAREAS